MNLPAIGSIVLFLLAPLLFASNMLVARWINQLIPPMTLAYGRWLIAAIILFPFVSLSLKKSAPICKQHWKELFLLALLGGALSVAPQYAAAHDTSAGHIALIFALSPVLVSLLDRLIWKTPLTGQIILGAAIAFFGISIAVFEGDIHNIATFNINRGDCLAFVAALAWAGYTALLKRHPIPLHPFTLLWIVAAGGAAILMPLIPVERAMIDYIPELSTRTLGGMLFVALVAGIAAYLVYGKIIQLFGAARASMSMYLVPIYAFILGDLLLGEALQRYHFVAIVFVFSGVILATLRRKPLYKK